LQSKVNFTKAQLIELEGRLAKMEVDTKARLSVEKTEFDKYKATKQAEIQNRLNEVQVAERDISLRKTDLEQRELKNMKVQEERNLILNERMKYEKLNNEATQKKESADKLYDEAAKKADEAANKELLAENKLKESKNLLSIAENKEAENKQILQDILKQNQNLISLRGEVNPKIDELNALITKNNKVLGEISKKEQGVKDKIEQDEKLLATLSIKQKAIDQQKIELMTKQEELLRKDLELKSKK